MHQNQADHTFEMTLLEEVKMGYPVYYYPTGTTNGGNDGLIVQVHSYEQGQDWIGIFAFGDIIKTGMNALYYMPDAKSLCVVSQGCGYIVAASAPTQWETVKAVPVTDVKIVRSKGLIVFSDFTELIAYDGQGIKWITKRLSFDGHQLTGQNEQVITGTYYDLRTEAAETFEVNLDNGTHTASAGAIDE